MRVGVVGIGGLGHLALQFARAMGCEVIAISSSPDKAAEARGFGAHQFLATREPKALRSAAGTLDFVLSTAFVGQDWAGLVGALRPNGVFCFVGAPAEPLSLNVGALLGGQKTVTTSVIGGRPGIREMLSFAARHGVAAKLPSARWPGPGRPRRRATRPGPLRDRPRGLRPDPRYAGVDLSLSFGFVLSSVRSAKPRGRPYPTPIPLPPRRATAPLGPGAGPGLRSKGSQGDHDHGGEAD
jgi:hypothetical protein